MRKLIWLLLFPVQLLAQPFSKTEISKWQQQASKVTIIRDNWGIPHIYGKRMQMLYSVCYTHNAKMISTA